MEYAFEVKIILECKQDSCLCGWNGGDTSKQCVDDSNYGTRKLQFVAREYMLNFLSITKKSFPSALFDSTTSLLNSFSCDAGKGSLLQKWQKSSQDKAGIRWQ